MDTRVEHDGKHRVPTDHVNSKGADDNDRPAVVRATSAISRDADNNSTSRNRGQQNELEPLTTEASTSRLNRTLSTQMCNSFVICNANVNLEFAGRRQFVREWEPRFVELLRNVLSCRCKDDTNTATNG